MNSESPAASEVEHHLSSKNGRTDHRAAVIRHFFQLPRVTDVARDDAHRAGEALTRATAALVMNAACSGEIGTEQEQYIAVSAGWCCVIFYLDPRK